MLSDQKYVVLSLELHLFFARIMKEHALFLEAGFTPKNVNLAREADSYKTTIEAILARVVDLSNGIVRPMVLNSGEIVTDFTLGSEQKTQNFTGIPINQSITRREAQLRSGTNPSVTPAMVEDVRRINQNMSVALNGLINFKIKLLDDVLSCKVFTVNYPLLIEHILREAELYRDYLMDLENKEDIEERDLDQTELFWDQIMMEHALFIRGLLDPSEDELINTADDFAQEYADLLEKAQNATDQTLANVTDETLRETIKFKDFKQAGTEGIAACKIRSIILPLLADHVLREANHYIRLLRQRPMNRRRPRNFNKL